MMHVVRVIGEVEEDALQTVIQHSILFRVQCTPEAALLVCADSLRWPSSRSCACLLFLLFPWNDAFAQPSSSLSSRSVSHASLTCKNVCAQGKKVNEKAERGISGTKREKTTAGLDVEQFFFSKTLLFDRVSISFLRLHSAFFLFFEIHAFP